MHFPPHNFQFSLLPITPSKMWWASYKNSFYVICKCTNKDWYFFSQSHRTGKFFHTGGFASDVVTTSLAFRSSVLMQIIQISRERLSFPFPLHMWILTCSQAKNKQVHDLYLKGCDGYAPQLELPAQLAFRPILLMFLLKSSLQCTASHNVYLHRLYCWIQTIDISLSVSSMNEAQILTLTPKAFQAACHSLQFSTSYRICIESCFYQKVFPSNPNHQRTHSSTSKVFVFVLSPLGLNALLKFSRYSFYSEP